LRSRLAKSFGVDKVAYDIKSFTNDEYNREAEVSVPQIYDANFASFVAIPDSDHIEVNKRVAQYEKIMEPLQYCPNPVDTVAGVSEILATRFPSSSDYNDTHSGFTHREFPEVSNDVRIKEPKHFKTMALGEETTNRYWRFMAPNFGRRTTMAPDNILYTLIKRFGTNKKKYEMSDYEMTNKLRQSFNALVPNKTRIQADDLSNAYAEQVRRIKLKGDKVNAAEFNNTYADRSKITLFNKPQKKVKMAEESYLQHDNGTLKAGQPVSAQPKFITHLMGVIITVLEKNIRKDFRPDVMFGYGYSKKQIGEEIRKRLHGLEDHVCFESDISEMDSVRDGPINDGFMSYVYESYGVDETLTKWLQANNDFWAADAETIRMSVQGMFQSGRADTLFSNSLVNLTLCNMCFDITEPKLIMSQGDDFVCVASKISIKHPFKFFKCGEVEIPEFTSDIITQDGIFPSIIKKAGKLINREFKSVEDLMSYRIAVKDWFNGYYSIEDYYKIIALNSYKYELGFEEIKMCLDFMLTFANTDVYIPKKQFKLKSFKMVEVWHPDINKITNTTLVI